MGVCNLRGLICLSGMLALLCKGTSCKRYVGVVVLRYELYGVVAHSGRLASSGHYLSYVRNRDANSSLSAEENTLKTPSPTSAAIKSKCSCIGSTIKSLV